MNAKLICALISLVSNIELCQASQITIKQATSVELKYEGGINVVIHKKLQKLDNLAISIKGISNSIPIEEMKDIVNPELELIKFQMSPNNDAEESEIWITLKFNRRIYDWGDGVSTVIFKFVGGKYTQRDVSRQSTINEEISRNKKIGQPEDN